MTTSTGRRTSHLEVLASIRTDLHTLLTAVDHNLDRAGNGKAPWAVRQSVRAHEQAARDITAVLSGLAVKIFDEEMAEASSVDNATTGPVSAFPER